LRVTAGGGGGRFARGIGDHRAHRPPGAWRFGRHREPRARLRLLQSREGPPAWRAPEARRARGWGHRGAPRAPPARWRSPGS